MSDPVTFALVSKYTSCPQARVEVGCYHDGSPAWQVYGDCGAGYEEPINTPTVCLDEPPPAGHVYIRVGEQYAGWLQSLVAAGLVEDTDCRAGMGYAALCAVLDPRLLRVPDYELDEEQSRRQWLSPEERSRGE